MADAFFLLSGNPRQGYADRFMSILELVRPDLHPQLHALEANPRIVDDMILRNRKSEVTDADGDLSMYGVPAEWLGEVREATEDTLFELAEHLPQKAAEALLNFGTDMTPQIPAIAATEVDPFTHPAAQRRFLVLVNCQRRNKKTGHMAAFESLNDSEPPPLRPAEQGQGLGPVEFQTLEAGVVEACEIQRDEERSYVIPQQLDHQGREALEGSDLAPLQLEDGQVDQLAENLGMEAITLLSRHNGSQLFAKTGQAAVVIDASEIEAELDRRYSWRLCAGGDRRDGLGPFNVVPGSVTHGR